MNHLKTTKQFSRTRILIDCALMVALATVLSFFKVWEAPLGGAVTLFSLSPLFLLSFKYGAKIGLFTSFVYSTLQLLLGMGNLAYIPSLFSVVLCALLDYILPFTIIGLSGLAKKSIDASNGKKAKKLVNAFLAVLITMIIKFASHFFVGTFIWYEITKVGDWNTYVHTVGASLYSLVYNATFMVPETILCLIAVPVCLSLLEILNKRRKT